MPTPQRKLGDYGEALVAKHLAAQQWTIIERNWQCPKGELDIVAHDGEEWVFVEVRTRRAPNTDAAAESITSRKHKRLLNAVHAYFNAHNLDEVPWRIDLALVAVWQEKPVIEIIRDAFEE